MNEFMFILLTHDKLKFLINDEEYRIVLKALNANKKFIVLQGSTISLQIAPAIISFSRWFTQENERLKNTDKRLCNLCLCIMNIYDKCDCWKEMGKGKEQNAFDVLSLPESIKKLLPTMKSFPQITREEIENVETLRLQEKFHKS